MIHLREFKAKSVDIEIIPPKLGVLNQLRKFEISGSSKLSAVPSDDDNFPISSLLQLVLEANAITELPSSLGRLTNLNQLEADHNLLSGTMPWLASLTKLTDLTLHHSKLTGLAPELEKLSNLEYLGIANCNMRDLGSPSAPFYRLETLIAGNNHLSTLPESFGKSTQLQTVYLSNNTFTDLPLWVGRMSNLELLHVGNNRLTAVPEAIRQLRGAQRLEWIDLRHNNIADVRALQASSTGETSMADAAMADGASGACVHGGKLGQSNVFPACTTVLLWGNPICNRSGDNTTKLDLVRESLDVNWEATCSNSYGLVPWHALSAIVERSGRGIRKK